MNQISVNIKLLSPMVLSASNNTTVMTESLSYFSGTALRGILAERYITCNNLGKAAHENEKFRQLFFNNLRFIAANPIYTKTGQRSFVLPLSIQKEKSGLQKDDCSLIQDLMGEKNPQLGYKNLRGYAVEDEGILYTINIDKNIHLHMSRSSSKERLLGSSRDGNIYNYESINEGQEFQGFILGEEEDIKSLLNDLKLQEGSFITYAGRSKYTQYGKCQIIFDEIKAILLNTVKVTDDNAICLRFDTPYIPKPGLYKNVNEQFQEIIRIIDKDNSNHFQIDNIYADQMEIENFVGIWKMRRPCKQALSAGTIFRLKKDSDWTEEEVLRLNKLLYEGCGIRREEGFGQLRLWSLKTDKTKKADDLKHFENLAIPEDVEEIVKKIIKERILNQLRIYAAEDARILRGIGQNTHFFSELDNMLQQAKMKSMERISGTMKSILQESPQNEKGRPFNDHMTRIYLNGSNFEDIFKNIIIPYKNRDWQEDVGGIEQLKDLFKKINLQLSEININDGEYFYEYWHCLFREARKITSINKEVA